ncbi:MAG: DEAD/DEAH box helicase family protein [Planctomycetes bacterium]|nr:DEAD/DEAH box helicase family protein [Planctomycetota bacterium]
MLLVVGALIRDRSEPSRGNGRVRSLGEEGWAEVAWPDGSVGEMRLVDQDDLVRTRLQPGQRVSYGEFEGVVAALESDPSDALWSYRLDLPDGEAVASEDALEPLGASLEDPCGVLESLAWEGADAFAARLGLLRTLSRWYENGFGIPAFLGARIVPLPHQIHAARRVLTDRLPRFVLADEVGLGKTIEAGLILQALSAAQAGLRVLVIAPGAMSRQWLCELFLRFGEQVFVHVDAGRLGGSDDETELLSAPRLIVSTTALESSPRAREILLAQDWDVLVVDEAHQIHPDAGLYGFVRTLASAARGMLALSATPAKGDTRGLLGLLGLVSPDVYDPAHPERFERALAARDAVSACLDKALAALESPDAAPKPAWIRATAAELASLLPDDTHVCESALALDATPDGAALSELLAYVQEYHRVDRRIVRTRRATVRALGTRLCQREQVSVDYEPDPAELALLKHMEAAPSGEGPMRLVLRGLFIRRALTAPLPLLALLDRRRRVLEQGDPSPAVEFDPLASLGADPGPAEEEYLLERVLHEAPPLPGERAWLATAIERTKDWMAQNPHGCARTRAALAWLRREGRRGKILVFAQDREVVEAFAETLADELGIDAVGAIHHGLDEQRLSEIALRFQQADGPCKVLISDELGGEGRNFQIAQAVLHLDQPWAVGKLEQRIGRLDRIGRPADRPVRSAVLIGPAPSERALLALHAEVLGVYRRSLGGLEFLLPTIQRQTTEAICRGAEHLEALRGPLSERVEAERTRADASYDRSLDASARQLEEASDQAEVLAEVDGTLDAPSVAAWAARLGITFKSIGDEQWSAGWNWEHLRRPPPGLIPPGGVPEEGRARKRGTFSRLAALKDESLELFAPGHPLIDALVRDVIEVSEGRAAVLTRNLGPDHRGHAYLLVAGRTLLPEADLPAGVRYRAQAYLWPQVRLATLRLRPGAEPAAERVSDRKLQRVLETPDSSDQTLDPDVLAKSVDLPGLWSATRAGVALALEAIGGERKPEVEDAVQRLEADLAHDLAYLRGALARAEPEARAGLEEELAVRERLVKAVAAERVELAALAIVVGV